MNNDNESTRSSFLIMTLQELREKRANNAFMNILTKCNDMVLNGGSCVRIELHDVFYDNDIIQKLRALGLYDVKEMSKTRLHITLRDDNESDKGELMRNCK